MAVRLYAHPFSSYCQKVLTALYENGTPFEYRKLESEYAHVRAYRRRLLARPSFARAVDEAPPYRPNFPLGAPNRD